MKIDRKHILFDIENSIYAHLPQASSVIKVWTPNTLAASPLRQCSYPPGSLLFKENTEGKRSFKIWQFKFAF